MYYERLMQVSGMTKSAGPSLFKSLIVNPIKNVANKTGRFFGGGELRRYEGMGEVLDELGDAMTGINGSLGSVVNRAKTRAAELGEKVSDMVAQSRKNPFGEKEMAAFNKAQAEYQHASGMSNVYDNWLESNKMLHSDGKALRSDVQKEVDRLNRAATRRGGIILGGTGLGLGGLGAYALSGGDDK